LNIGDTYELTRDGWSDPPGGGTYTGDVLPKSDTNNGLSGDNPYFRRHNVARAWSSGTGYWFTGPDQHEGEPAPSDEQWVDYAPPFEILGGGRYALDASYRGASARASYPAVYRICHALGTNEVLRDQRIGANIVWFSLGEFEMRPGSFVRVEDTASESVTFANMRFRLLVPAPALKVEYSSGECLLRWPTNAVGYRLEATADLTPAASWESVWPPPEIDGNEYKVSLPAEGSTRFFRLISP
jgi:hypothetical protein